MRTLKFYGASDDLFEIEGTTGDEPDEIGCIDRPAIVEVSASISGDLVCGFRVVAHYAVANNACWMIGVSPIDEDVNIPSWPMFYRLNERGYSAELVVRVPDDVIVSEVKS